MARIGVASRGKGQRAAALRAGARGTRVPRDDRLRADDGERRGRIGVGAHPERVRASQREAVASGGGRAAEAKALAAVRARANVAVHRAGGVAREVTRDRPFDGLGPGFVRGKRACVIEVPEDRRGSRGQVPELPPVAVVVDRVGALAGRQVHAGGVGERRRARDAAGMPEEVGSGRVRGLDAPCPAERVGRLGRIGNLAEIAFVIPGSEAEGETPVPVVPDPSAPVALGAALTRGHSDDREAARGGDIGDRVAVGEDIESRVGGGQAAGALRDGLDVAAHERRGVEPEEPVFRLLEDVLPAVGRRDSRSDPDDSARVHRNALRRQNRGKKKQARENQIPGRGSSLLHAKEGSDVSFRAALFRDTFRETLRIRKVPEIGSKGDSNTFSRSQSRTNSIA